MAPALLKFLALLVAVGSTQGAATSNPYCPNGCQCVWLDIICDDVGLTAVPGGDWSYVWDLFLNGNNITSLPDDAFAGYPKLTSVYLNDNPLTALDLDVFARVDRLSSLRVASNAIAAILPPKGDARLGALDTLVLSFNQLKALDPHVFDAAPYLRYLFLDGNPLSVPGDGPLLVHSTVAQLALDGTDASQLSALSLADLPNLDTLSLNASDVRSLEGVLTCAPQLWSLSAAGNALTTLTADAFAPAARLNELRLDDNLLKTLDAGVLARLTNGATLSIADTPLACDCAYEGVLSWAKSHSAKLNATCSIAPPCSFAAQ